tara:strand:+ start:2316 stop:2561 length:246 start_codon:yes stop_codon:yes gene_type:complete
MSKHSNFNVCFLNGDIIWKFYSKEHKHIKYIWCDKSKGFLYADGAGPDTVPELGNETFTIEGKHIKMRFNKETKSWEQNDQ